MNAFTIYLFLKKYSKEYVLIGTGKTKLLQNKYNYFYYK